MRKCSSEVISASFQLELLATPRSALNISLPRAYVWLAIQRPPSARDTTWLPNGCSLMFAATP